MLAAGAPGAEKAVPLVRASATFRDRARDGTNTPRDGPHGAIDGTHATRWDVYQHTGKAHSLTVDLGAPVRGRMVVRIDCRDPIHAQSLVLGRFRLSVTDRPNVARDENLIALAAKGGGWAQLGVARVVRGEWREAVAPLQKAAEVPTGAFDAHVLLALVCEKLGQPAEADKSFDAALKHNRAIDPLILELSLDVIDQRIARDPKNARLLLRRFRWHAATGNAAAAAADLDRAFALDRTQKLEPSDITTLRSLDDIVAERGDWGRVAAVYAIVLDSNPDDLKVLYRAATVHAFLGNADEYQRACERLFKVCAATSDPGTGDFVAKACSLQPGTIAERSRVSELAERNADSKPVGSLHPWFYATKGLTDYRNGRFAAAVMWCEKCLASGPNNRDALRVFARHILAMSQYRQGEVSKARATLAGRSRITPSPGLGSGDWHSWMNVYVIQREAEALMALPVAPPPRELK